MRAYNVGMTTPYSRNCLEDTYQVRWEGGHGLHLYNRANWQEVQYRTVGDMSRDLTRAEIRRQVQSWARWIDSGDPAALEFS